MDRRMSLYKLDILCTVVEMGGVGIAAEHLRVTQPVVTAHIRSLEGHLGVKLFVRKGRRLELTSAGRLAYEWAKDSDVRTRQLERKLASLPSGSQGSVVVAAGMSVGSYRLPAVIADYLLEQTDTRITLEVLGPDEVINSVVDGRSDFGVLIADEIARDQRLHYEQVGTEPLLVVGAPGPLTASGPLAADALARIPFISTPRAHIRRTVEERHLHHIGVSNRRVIAEFGHPEAMKIALYKGLGIAVMFRCAVLDDLAAGKLVEYVVEGFDMREPILFLTRNDTRLTTVQRRIYAAFARGLRDMPTVPSRGGEVNNDELPDEYS